MTIQKNAIPILEFDDDPSAVIMPAHERLDLRLPERAVFAFLADHIDTYARDHQAEIVTEFESATKKYPIYVTEYQGEKICLVQAPVGAAAAAQLLDWLSGYGVRKVISAGSCGALQDFAENEFLIPYKALRDEGTSYHYAPPSRFMEISPEGRKAIADTLDAHGIPWQEVITWTTDGFFRETREKVAYRMAEGCAVVEMECSALAAVAAMRGITWAMMLFTADTLANVDAYDERNWGQDGLAAALRLCFDAVIRL